MLCAALKRDVVNSRIRRLHRKILAGQEMELPQRFLRSVVCEGEILRTLEVAL